MVLRTIGLFLLCILLQARYSIAQPRPFFGSGDAPDEQVREVRWNETQNLDMMGGLSLIGAQWRTAGNLSAQIRTGPFIAHLNATLRAGIYGTYRPDVNESYDLLRVLSYLRFNAASRSRMYFRVGPIRRMRLGTGHLVDFFSSKVAWDARTVGTEMMWQGGSWEIAAFTDNVLFDGIIGGRFAFSPLLRLRNARLRSLRLGINYVRDLAALPDSTHRLQAMNVEARLDALRSGAFFFSPFASWGRVRHQGTGVFVGADLFSNNFIDLARLKLRIGFQFNGHRFIPGYVGTFYPVQNAHAQVERFSGPDGDQSEVAVIELENGKGDNTFVTEFRVLIFNSFEFWMAFNRTYGDQALSTFHLRLFLRTRRFRLLFSQDRGGLGSIFTVFNNVGNLSALDFQTDYRVVGQLWVFVRARYSYERIADSEPRVKRFLVQRRFEPFTGFRLSF